MDSIVADYKLQIDNFNKSVSDIEKGYLETEKAASKASKAATAAINSERVTVQELIDDLRDLTKQRNLSTDPKAIENYNARIAENRNLVKQMTTVQSNLNPVLVNTKTQFNALGNSINQLTREAPAFANSFNTGFMAISNNIPALTDALGQIKAKNAALRAEGQPTVSAFKQIAGAVFSWGTAISVGVTLLTVFGGKIVELIGSLFDGAEANNRLNESLEAGSEKMVKATVGAATYFDVLKNGNLTEVERKQAIDNINTAYGQYLPNLLTITSSEKDFAAAQELVNKALERKVILMIQEDEAVKRTLAVQEAQKNYNDQLALAEKNGLIAKKEARQADMAGIETIDIRAAQIKKLLAGEQKAIDDAKKSWASLGAETDKFAKTLGIDINKPQTDFNKLRAEQEKAAAELLKGQKTASDKSKKIADDAAAELAKAQDEANKRFEAGLDFEIDAAQKQAAELKLLSDLKIANLADETDKLLAKEDERYEEQKYKFRDNKAVLEQLELQHLANVEKIILDAGAKEAAEKDKLAKAEVAANKETNDKKAADDKAAAAAKAARSKAAFDLAVQAVGAIQAIANDAMNEDLANIETQRKAELDAIKESGGNKKKEAAINAKYDKEAAELKIKQAKLNKGLALLQIGIKIGEALANYISNPATAPLAPFVIAALGIEAAVVAAKPIPKYEKGGLIRGKRHSSGGELIEGEDFEFVHNRKAVQHYGVRFMEQINSLQLPKMTNYRDIAKGFDSHGGQSFKVKAELDDYRLMKEMGKNTYVSEQGFNKLVKAFKSNHKSPRI